VLPTKESAPIQPVSTEDAFAAGVKFKPPNIAVKRIPIEKIANVFFIIFDDSNYTIAVY